VKHLNADELNVSDYFFEFYVKFHADRVEL